MRVISTVFLTLIAGALVSGAVMAQTCQGSSPPGLFDPLQPAYKDAPPPRIKVAGGRIRVALPNNIPGVTCVTVTIVAFNNAELCTQSIQCPPFDFNLPVMDGCKSVRVRIDYQNNGLSATSYSL